MNMYIYKCGNKYLNVDILNIYYYGFYRYEITHSYNSANKYEKTKYDSDTFYPKYIIIKNGYDYIYKRDLGDLNRIITIFIEQCLDRYNINIHDKGNERYISIYADKFFLEHTVFKRMCNLKEERLNKLNKLDEILL